jgi:hypothetical protein
MNQPSVFISCVSPEFRQTRSRVAAILTRLGYTPIIQEIFGTEPGDLRQVLRNKIEACEGLIQIVGHGYGAEPPTVDADYGRVSYTQFEFLYARQKNKKTWLLFAGDACTRDTTLERLDLPNDPAHPDPAGYQAERRALQLTYRDKRRNDGHLYYDATSDADLELKVERLRDELAELRWAFKLWQNKVLRAFAVVFVLLALIGGSVWWFGYSQHREIQGISEEASSRGGQEWIDVDFLNQRLFGYELTKPDQEFFECGQVCLWSADAVQSYIHWADPCNFIRRVRMSFSSEMPVQTRR